MYSQFWVHADFVDILTIQFDLLILKSFVNIDHVKCGIVRKLFSHTWRVSACVSHAMDWSSIQSVSLPCGQVVWKMDGWFFTEFDAKWPPYQMFLCESVLSKELSCQMSLQISFSQSESRLKLCSWAFVQVSQSSGLCREWANLLHQLRWEICIARGLKAVSSVFLCGSSLCFILVLGLGQNSCTCEFN